MCKPRIKSRPIAHALTGEAAAAQMLGTEAASYGRALELLRPTGLSLEMAAANVAKGVDLIALKIREVAEKADVPVVENPPLARALHKSVEIDAEVPEEHYRAVAEVVGYVMKLRKQRR